MVSDMINWLDFYFYFLYIFLQQNPDRMQMELF